MGISIDKVSPRPYAGVVKDWDRLSGSQPTDAKDVIRKVWLGHLVDLVF